MAFVAPKSVSMSTSLSLAPLSSHPKSRTQISSLPSPFMAANPPKYKSMKASCKRIIVAAEQNAASPSSETPFRPALPTLDGGYETVCTFSSYGNWLLPGSLMLGRYPYVEPSRCLSREQGEQQLEALIQAGITTFVSLQEEVPPQDAMRLGGVGGFLPYKATATLLAAALSDHPTFEEISGLRTPDLDKFLPPRRKAVTSQRRRIELDFAHYPILDLSIPSGETLETLIRDIIHRINRGESLYVHCWGGRGRAGTVGAAVLSTMYGLSADEALERVQRSFDTRKDENRRSPETDEQHAFIRQFIQA